MTKEQWREHYNLANQRFEALQKELDYIGQVLKKLKTRKPSESTRGRANQVPNHIPCTCASPDSFKKRVDTEVRARSLREKEAREEQKERKLKRMTKFQQSCKMPGMSCFTVDNDTWQVPPKWTGPPQCHCTSASNSTYSCLRRIGHGAVSAEQNYLYCEFKESGFDGAFASEYNPADYFREYYDLDRDPYQLENIFDTLDLDLRTQLNKELRQRAACSGENCRCAEQKLNPQGKLICLEEKPGLRKLSHRQNPRPRSSRSSPGITSWRKYFYAEESDS